MDKIFAMNKDLKAICDESKNMYFIDTEKAFLGADGKPRSDLFISDQLHLNRQGYIIWTSLIKASLDKNLGK
jgi:lysophospholipase L1-like esterase